MDADDPEVVQVVGCLCTPLDLFGDKVALSPAEVGDLIVLYQASAYGLTVSATGFLSDPPRRRCAYDERFDQLLTNEFRPTSHE
jgi:diaminopimelate decarboxylase